MAKEIPGFYFDEEKGKYFRIQQSHRVTPGTGYTKQSIKAAALVKQDEQRVEQQVRRQRATKIRRSPLSIQTTSPLSARLGASVQCNIDNAVRQYCSGISLEKAHIKDAFLGLNFCISESSVLHGFHQAAQDYETTLPFSLVRSHIWSASRPSDFVTTLYTGDEEYAVVLSDGSPCFSVLSNNNAQSRRSDTTISWTLAGHGVESIWDIGVARDSMKMALATDAGLHISEGPDIHNLCFTRVAGVKQREQMNATFKDTYVVMSGERSGRVNFTDTRNTQSVARLLHSSAVLATQALANPNLVLVHGTQTTNIYDLRWTPQVSVRRHYRAQDHSPAYNTFAVPPSRHSDHYTRGRKVAYSSDMNLIAAASANTSRNKMQGFVTLYSATTGRILDSSLTRHVYDDSVTCVDIRRVRDGPESVFCLSEKSLHEWRHGGMKGTDMKFYGLKSDKNRAGDDNLSTSLSFEQEWERTRHKAGGSAGV